VRADLVLARRLERDEGLNTAEATLAYGREAPEVKVATLAVGGGWAAYAGVGSFLTQAKGMGMDGPVERSELDRLEDFFMIRGAAAQVSICPLADPSLLELSRRNYRVLEFDNVLVAEPAHVVAPPASPGVEVWRASPEEFDLWAETSARGFFPDPDALAKARPAFRAFVGMPAVTSFLARVDGQVAGAGAYGVRDGLAGFFATSVLPEFRGRGAHRELIRARLDSARAAGSDLCSVGASPGSDSQRNFERWGFRVAYTKTILIREWT